MGLFSDEEINSVEKLIQESLDKKLRKTFIQYFIEGFDIVKNSNEKNISLIIRNFFYDSQFEYYISSPHTMATFAIKFGILVAILSRRPLVVLGVSVDEGIAGGNTVNLFITNI